MSTGDLTPEDRRMVIEGRVLNIFTDKRFGGKRIVDSKEMKLMQKVLIDEFIKMRNEGLL